MKKLLNASFLVAAVLWLAGTADLAGQDRKRPPTKSGGAATSAKAGTVEIIESRDGKFRFTVRDADGKYVGGSAVGHETEKEARDAVEELRKALAGARFVNKKAETDKKDK
jgi:hypothetical protein